jgi:hypothetical protein
MEKPNQFLKKDKFYENDFILKLTVLYVALWALVTMMLVFPLSFLCMLFLFSLLYLSLICLTVVLGSSFGSAFLGDKIRDIVKDVTNRRGK